MVYPTLRKGKIVKSSSSFSAFYSTCSAFYFHHQLQPDRSGKTRTFQDKGQTSIYGPCETTCPITYPAVSFERNRISRNVSHPNDPEAKARTMGPRKKKTLEYAKQFHDISGPTAQKTNQDWKQSREKYIISSSVVAIEERKNNLWVLMRGIDYRGLFGNHTVSFHVYLEDYNVAY